MGQIQGVLENFVEDEGIQNTVKVLNFRTLKMLLKPPQNSNKKIFPSINLCPKGVGGMANSEDPDQTAPLAAL